MLHSLRPHCSQLPLALQQMLLMIMMIMVMTIWREWCRWYYHHNSIIYITLVISGVMANFRLRGCIPVASWQRGVRTQSIYRLWLNSKTVVPEYVSATGWRQKISIHVSVVHAHSLAPPCWIFNVCDVVVKQLLGLPQFQILLLIVYNHINTICAIIQRLFRQNKLL